MEEHKSEERINVRMTATALFDFTLYHTYSKFTGFLTNILGMAVVFMGIIMFVRGEIKVTHLVLYIAAGIAFVAYTPLLIKYRSKKQAMFMKEYKEEREFVFNEVGIITIQYEKKQVYTWAMIQKVVATPKTIGFYYGMNEALIIPKESFGRQFVAIMKIMETYVPPQNIKIR